MQRRQFLSLSAVAAAASVAGCDKGQMTAPVAATVDQVNAELERKVEETSTDQLENYRVALRGYEIVSGMIGPRVFFLPYPGMRILSVLIVATTVSAKLVVKYIDTELIQRQLEEDLKKEERTRIEADGYVAFKTESGVEERTFLAPTQYA
ncbi:hypothetical protein LOC71_02475 [Rhodopirellula sp. JC740]|uniref:Uncharacterized protein n=1 Tax=Rhodopirellula halodulae TaxID=2894198 RepID=A0ABS8NDX2_9BACT|nr:hypothetical protein [Rhodopirellula sp. JC740]MCC9641122.1 hypothetical protein [Rhodopirellula sp. JC740]